MKRNAKQTKKPCCLLCTLTVLLSHMDFALITELNKKLFSLIIFCLFLRQNYLCDFLICFLSSLLFSASDYVF